MVERNRLALRTPMEKMPSLAVTDAVMAAWAVGLVEFILQLVAMEEMEGHQAAAEAQEGQGEAAAEMEEMEPEAKFESLVGR